MNTPLTQASSTDAVLISRDEARHLLNQMSLIEYSVESAMFGDLGGPLTSSATQRLNLTNVLRETAETLLTIADLIDPLASERDPHAQAVS